MYRAVLSGFRALNTFFVYARPSKMRSMARINKPQRYSIGIDDDPVFGIPTYYTTTLSIHNNNNKNAEGYIQVMYAVFMSRDTLHNLKIK